MADVKSSEQICREFIAIVAKDYEYDSDFKIIPFMTDGANYTSHLFITTLKKNGESEDIFVKVASAGEKFRAQSPMRLYETEIHFYTKIAKFFHGLEEKNSIPDEHRLRIPKFYACKPKTYEETLVLENLATKGFTIHNRQQVVDWEYAAAAITVLAKYHALSAAYRKRHPEEFQKDAEKIKLDFMKNKNKQVLYQTLVDKAVAATRKENRDRLRKFLEARVMNMRTFLEYFRSKKLTVLTHGDFRTSNLMHRRSENGGLEVMLVDFQTAQVGSPITDLMYFIITATDEAFRREHYHRLVEHYYAQLSRALARLGLDPQETYSKEDFDSELQEKRGYGLCVAIFVLPLITVDAKNVPKVDKDLDLSSFTVQLSGDLYLQRLNGLVDDYVRWGDL